MGIRIDWRRAYAVIDTALAAYRSGAYPYQNPLYPQDFLPADILADPLAASRILFYSCHYMRGTIKSDYAMQCMVRLYRKHPEFFDPFKVIVLDAAEVQRVLDETIRYKSGEIARSWIENSKRLAEYWQGDPRAIYREVHTPEDLYRLVVNKQTTKGHQYKAEGKERGFLGFQKKMASMLTYYLEACLLISKVELAPTPPVDFHIIRVLTSTNVMRNGGVMLARYETLHVLGVTILTRYMRKHPGVESVELGNALWSLSNRLCAGTPCTTTKDLKLVPPDWDNPGIRAAYARTCGACPLERMCANVVQAGFYYKKGMFELGRPRPKPPQEGQMHLFNAEAPHVFPKRKRKVVAATSPDTTQLIQFDWLSETA